MDASVPVYLNTSACPTCQTNSEYHAAPLIIVLVILGVLFIIFMYIMSRLWVTTEKLKMCKAFSKIKKYD